MTDITTSLSSEDQKRVSDAVDVIVAYLENSKTAAEGIKDTLSSLVENLRLSKKDAPRIKRAVKKVATAKFKDEVARIREETEEVDGVLKIAKL